MSNDNVDVVSFGGNLSPEQLLISALQQCRDAQGTPAEWRLTVVVLIDDETNLHMGRSDGSSLRAIGLLDWAQMQIRHALRY